MATNEKWKDVKDYEGVYRVSSLGNIKRIYKTTPERLLSPVSDKGYHLVTLCKDNKKANIRVHQAVASAFIGERSEGLQVNHINGVKHDNRTENLEYVTPFENTQHAISLGLHDNYGEKNGNSKLTREKVLKMRELFSNGCSRKVITKQFGIDYSVVCKIIKGRSWCHIS